jgi:hypothetical protein
MTGGCNGLSQRGVTPASSLRGEGDSLLLESATERAKSDVIPVHSGLVRSITSEPLVVKQMLL